MDGERIQTQIARFPNEAATQGDPSVVDVPLANASACHRSIHTTGGNPVGLTLMALSIMAIAILMGACGGGNGETGPQPEDARVTVEEIVNQVETNRPRGSDTGEFLNARVGQDLLTGDGVKTLRDSEARVDIVVLGHFRIARTKPNTVWRLGQFAVDRDTVIELDQGKIFVFDEGFREDRPTVDVVTPAGTASARGTWMSVAFDPDTGVADIQCFRGICELANDQGSVVLTDEQKSTMTAQAAPIEPQAMGELDLLEFTQLPEAESGEVAIPAPRVSVLSQAPTRLPTPLPTPTRSDTPTPLITLAPADMPTSTPIPPATEAPTLTPIPPVTEAPTSTPIPPAAEAPTSTPIPPASEAPTSMPIPPASEAPTSTPLPVSTPTAPSTPVASDEEALRWTASADGSWHDPANWSNGAVPGPSDNVVIDVPGNVTITHSQGSTPISRLVLARGTLSVDSTIQVSNGFSQSGGTLTGSSDLVVGGLFTWTGGIMGGTGTTTADGGININGTGIMSLRRTLVNSAGETATWTNGNIGFFGTATFDNQGTFRAEHAGDRSLVNQGGGGVKAFKNAGSFIKAAPDSGTVATTTVGSPIVFNNTGLVEVQAGTLKLDGGITGGGDYRVAAGATLDFSPASAATLGSTADITGAGVVRFSGVTVDINGIYNITGETQFAGSVTFNALATLTSLSGGPVAISTGTVTFDSGETPINVTTFDLIGGTTGSDDVAASGLFTWTGGIMEGTGTTTADGGQRHRIMSLRIVHLDRWNHGGHQGGGGVKAPPRPTVEWNITGG